MATPPTTPPPGYYPANDGPFERYWDGARWTDRTRPFPPAATSGRGAGGGRDRGRGKTLGGTSFTHPGETAVDRTQRVNHSALRASGSWMKRHKIITGVVLVLILGSCSTAVSPTDEPEAKASDEAPQSVDPDDGLSSDETSEESPGEPSEELTEQDAWRANYEDNESQYAAAVLTALGGMKVAGDTKAAAIGTCNLILKNKPLAVRVKRVPRMLRTKGQPTIDQSLSFIDATIVDTCPDMAEVHSKQVTAYETAQRKAEAKKKAAAKKARLERLRLEREAREERQRQERAAREERQRQERERRAREAQANVYYNNCSEAEAAGAAPVYAGAPGYGTHLDRDGDGVGCEQ